MRKIQNVNLMTDDKNGLIIKVTYNNGTEEFPYSERKLFGLKKKYEKQLVKEKMIKNKTEIITNVKGLNINNDYFMDNYKDNLKLVEKGIIILATGFAIGMFSTKIYNDFANIPGRIIIEADTRSKSSYERELERLENEYNRIENKIMR